jgi:hypothetical protein
MNRKTIVMALIMAVFSTAGIAESVENSSPPQGKNESALAGGASFFEGVWVGEWEIISKSMVKPTRQDVTIAIDKKNEEGFHKTTYSWGWANRNPPGSLTVYGKEQDGAFTFWWIDREGNKRTVKLEKYKDDVVKGRVEREGLAVKQRPFFDGYLKRK